MKTAGLVLDFYDDPSASLLKENFPTVDTLPSMIKNAHILSQEEREVLRDEAYALIMNNEGTLLRKFACVDAGNTAISVMYFLSNMDKLPEEAAKTAAVNLAAACQEFELPVPAFLKTAAAKSMIRTRDSFKQPVVGDEADWAQRTNLQSVRGGTGAGSVMSAVSGMKTAAVDVSGKEAPHKFEKKASSRFALTDKYPLDSYADVQKAISYFSENYPEFGPEDRHQYCVKTAARAEELGLEIPELMARYGSTYYSEDIEAHMANRRAHCDAEFKPVYDELSEKQASIDPELFAELLTEADEAASLHWLWGGEVSDPYYATFGGLSEKKKEASWSWQGRAGDYVTGERLKNLALNGKKFLHMHFSHDITDAFQKDPIGIFESMPDTHKVILSRLAMDNGEAPVS